MADVAAALAAIGRGATDEALTLLADPAGADHPRVAAALATHLRNRGSGEVYSEPAAFRAFIDGGGNVALYRAVVDQLASRYRSWRPDTLLELGCGDGRVVATALAASGIRPRVDLVEPSAALLDDAMAAVASAAPSVPVTAHRMGAGDVLARPGRRWEVAQSTFALHTIAPGDRTAVLDALAARVDRLVLVEFDVPDFDDAGHEHAEYAAARYERGLTEYEGDLVAQGFLMPVLFGQFDPDRRRHTWEQPVAAWVDELRRAGFAAIRWSAIADYWWATAHLVEATCQSAAARTAGTTSSR